MKMRKALSFVLVLALVLGSFSMAFAADGVAQGSDLSDISGNANYDAIVANSDLGIITGYEDGSYKPANNVNRAEFAAMITRMLGVPDSALAGYSSTSFTDMTGYGWASSYVGFCAAKGIVNGYGNGTFGPGNTITVNEAVTMVLRAVGYVSNSDELVGTWPSNYVTLGKRLGIYDDVTSTTTIDRANAAQVIYNALTTVVVAVNADGDTRAAYTTGTGNDYYEKTVIEVYLDCEIRDAAVYTDSDADASVINTLEYVGAYVKAIENSDEEVIAIADVKSTFLKGDYNAGDKVFEVGDVEYNLDNTLAGNPLFENSAGNDDDAYAFTNGDETNQNAAALVDDNTYTLAVKLSGKTIKEVYSVATWTSVDAFQFEADMLEDDAINGYDFALDDDDNIDTKAYTLLGVASLDKIAEDNVVRVYLKGNTSNADIIKVTVGAETVEGKITIEDGDEVTIGGKEYTVAMADQDGLSTDPVTGDLDGNLGDTGTAYLDYDGKITFWDIDDASSENYAIVTGDLDQTGRDHTIILFDKTGTEKEYVVKSDAVVTGGPAAPYADLDAAEADFTEHALVTFGLDKNGKIDELTFLTPEDGTIGQITPTTPVVEAEWGELSATRTIFNNIRIDSGVVVFANDGYDGITNTFTGDYSVVSINDVETGEALEGTLVYKDSKIKVMIIDADVTGADSVYAVLNSVKNTFNDDDDEIQVVKGLASGKEYTAYTDDRFIAGADWGFSAGAPVVTKLSVNSDGVITKASSTTGTAGLITDGWVVSKSGRDLGIGAAWNTATASLDYAAIDPNAAVYVIDDGDYELGTWSSVKAKTTVAGSFVYLYQLDDDSEVYDLVIVDLAQTDAANDAIADAADVADAIADLTNASVTITDAAAQPTVQLNVPATVNGVTFTFTASTDDNATVLIAGNALTATVTRNAVAGTPTITVTATKGAATTTAVYEISVPAGATATDAVTVALQ